MIFVARTWHLDRGDYEPFARISEEDYWPLFETHGGRALGIWVVRMGAPERLMIMTRYESLDHWLDTRAWGDAAETLKAISDRRDEMIHETDQIALEPLSRRQPQGDAPEEGRGVYIWETFRVAPPDLERFREWTEDQWLPDAEQAGDLRLVGMWKVFIGPQNTVCMLTRADSVGTWKRLAQSCRPGNALPERTGLAEPISVQLLYSMTRRRP